MFASDDDSDRGWARELEFRKRRNQALDPRDPGCTDFGEGDEEEDEEN